MFGELEMCVQKGQKMPKRYALGLDVDDALLAAGLVDTTTRSVTLAFDVDGVVMLTTQKFLTRDELIRLGQHLAKLAPSPSADPETGNAD